MRCAKHLKLRFSRPWCGVLEAPGAGTRLLFSLKVRDNANTPVARTTFRAVQHTTDMSFVQMRHTPPKFLSIREGGPGQGGTLNGQRTPGSPSAHLA